MSQLMPLPLTVSCFSKIQIGYAFLVPAHLGNPGKRAVKRVRVCACVCLCLFCVFFIRTFYCLGPILLAVLLLYSLLLTLLHVRLLRAFQ